VNRSLLLIVLTISILFSASVVASNDALISWQDLSWGILDLDLKTLDIDSGGHRILTASSRSAYLSIDQGRTWELVFKLGKEAKNNSLLESSQNTNSENREVIFDRSDYDPDDLYRSGVLEEGEDFDDIDDEDLQKRLEDAGILEEQQEDDPKNNEMPESIESIDFIGIVQVAWDPSDANTAYLSTNKDLYISKDSGNTWTKNTALPGNLNIIGLAVQAPGGDLVVASKKSLYLSLNRGQSFQLLDKAFASEYFDIDQNISKESVLLACSAGIGVFGKGLIQADYWISESAGVEQIQSITIYDDDLFAAGNDRLYHYQPSGIWSVIPGVSFTGVKIKDIVLSEKFLLAATSRGVFAWDRSLKQGKYINTGLTEYNVRDIKFNPADREQIWIATSSGIYVSVKSRLLNEKALSRSEISEDLPALESVIESALRFAEVDLKRDSINSKKIRKRSCFPQINLVLAKKTYNWEGYAQSDVISLANGSVYIGPVDEIYVDIKKRSFDASVAFIWEPQFSIFSADLLKVRKRFSKEISRRNKIIQNISLLYTSILDEFIKKNTLSDTRNQVIIELKIQQLLAELDAATGFVYKLTAN